MRSALNNIALKITASLADAEIFLSRIPNDDPISFSKYVIEKIKSGAYKSLDIIHNGEVTGITVYYIEEFTADYHEFVSVATYTRKTVPHFSDFWKSEISNIARKLHCKSIRFSTVRNGLVASALNAGFTVSEITLRKILL